MRYELRLALIGTLCSLAACAVTQTPLPATPLSREAVFSEGYERLQELARHAPNEHLAFFVEWKDGTFSWGRWTEGSPLHVWFPMVWVPDLCKWTRHLMVAHTHTIDAPPSEPDVDLLHNMVRGLEGCGVRASKLIVTPETTWILEPLGEQPAQQCGNYAPLWKAGVRGISGVQEEIEHLAGKDEVMLIAYYRCVHSIRAHRFPTNPSASHP